MSNQTPEEKVRAALLNSTEYLGRKRLAQATGLSEKKVRQIVASLPAKFKVRVALQQSGGPASVAELAKSTRLQKSTVYIALEGIGAQTVEVRETGKRGRPARLFAAA